MNIFEKLSAVQTELKAPKGQYNSFGKYKYRSCEDIVEAVKPILARRKAVLTITDDVLMVGERHYVRATTHFIDTETGDEINTTAYAREEETKKGMDGSQVTGASSSYARKYALNALFAIDDTKDSDSTNTHGKEPKAEEEPGISRLDALRNAVMKVCKGDMDKADASAQKRFGCNFMDMTEKQLEEVLGK